MSQLQTKMLRRPQKYAAPVIVQLSLLYMSSGFGPIFLSAVLIFLVCDFFRTHLDAFSLFLPVTVSITEKKQADPDRSEIFVRCDSQPLFLHISSSWKPDNEFLRFGLIVWHPPTQRGEESHCGGSGWRFGTAILYKFMGGFPRTWYSGNHCCGRASQLGIGCHVLATGIPEVHRHLITTPMHPCCPQSARDWTPDWGSVCFWAVSGRILAVCKVSVGLIQRGLVLQRCVFPRPCYCFST